MREKIEKLEVDVETAHDFQNFIMELQASYIKERLWPGSTESVIEVGLAYRKKKINGEEIYYLEYLTVVRALLLAQQKKRNFGVIDRILGEEARIAHLALSDLPEDEAIYERYSKLVLFLEHIAKEEKLGEPITHEAMELYNLLWNRLSPSYIFEMNERLTSTQSRTNSPASRD
ncbi:MAG TPA: hypothetical protein VF209_05000 [Patescibacteria group bacterium]